MPTNPESERAIETTEATNDLGELQYVPDELRSLTVEAIVKGRDYTFYDKEGKPIEISSAKVVILKDFDGEETYCLPFKRDSEEHFILSIDDAPEIVSDIESVRKTLHRDRRRKPIRK